MDEILDETVSSEDLKKFEAIYNEQVEASNVTTDATFNYAWCLVRSRYAADIRKGICLLETLFRDGNEQGRRDYVYYLAIGNAKLKEYSKALHYVRTFLTLEPGNQQVQHLETVIRKRMEKDGLLGIALAGGVVLAIGGLVGLGMAIAKK
ncbi:mitochondrial fission 1 protein [Rhodnius prolixus]|uniref:Mitochondrial fission 1 protein n=2 Tax=Rhodnius TaxID=13248 RepID=T1HPA9_RHOPR